MSASSWSARTTEEVRICANFLKAQLHGFSATAVAQDWMSQEEVNNVSAEIDAWTSQSDPFYSETYCEGIGRK